jgi:hypothetical protein
MQKVVGSNPISRFTEGLQSAGFSLQESERASVSAAKELPSAFGGSVRLL